MNKTELIDAIAAEANLTKAEARRALDVILEVISESLEENEPVRLTGFGTFSVKERAERQGRNPQTGSEITIPAKRVVKFKPGSGRGIPGWPPAS